MNSKKLDLDKREFGTWFAPFERELIWIKQQEHIGWVVPTSSKTFKLQLTPFSKHSKNYTYIIPTPNLMPPNNICVEIKPFKIIRDIKLPGNSTYGEYNYYCIVDSFKEYKINILKPDIDDKDFIYYCSENWFDTEEDNLDKMLALQLVSCPSGLYGKGGIGAIASKISKHGNMVKSVVPQLSSTYNGIISSNFKKKNDKYYFNFIKNTSQINLIDKMRKQSLSEVNYCKPCLTFNEANLTTEKIPIQIPLLMTQASYQKSNVLNEKYLLLQYQLTALMINPRFEDNNSDLKTFKNNVLKVINQRRLDNIFNIDSNTINKLALSFCRLYLTDKLNDKKIDEAANMFFETWENWRTYTAKENPIRNFGKNIQANDFSLNVTHDDQRFIKELQNLHDETNEGWIDREILEQRLDKKIKFDFDDIAQNLVNLPLIIQKNNFNKFQLLDL